MGKYNAGISCSWTVRKVSGALTVAKGRSHAHWEPSCTPSFKIWESSSFTALSILAPEQDVRSWLRRFLDELTPDIQGFMFQKVWPGWNFNLPSVTPSLIWEMDLKSPFWDSECVTPPPPRAIRSVHLLLFTTWAPDRASPAAWTHPKTPRLTCVILVLWPLVLCVTSLGFCFRLGVSQMPWLLTVRPVILILPFLPQAHQLLLSLLGGLSLFWNFLVERLSYTYSFLDLKQYCSPFTLNLWIPTEFFMLQWDFIYLCIGYILYFLPKYILYKRYIIWLYFI